MIISNGTIVTVNYLLVVKNIARQIKNGYLYFPFLLNILLRQLSLVPKSLLKSLFIHEGSNCSLKTK